MLRVTDRRKTPDLPIVRDIQQRCEEIGVSLNELYRVVGARRFLTQSSIRRYGTRNPNFYDAVDALGGELYIEWEDK
ncbi:hypothetical protein VE25_07520 [Devosia geojensis]|uniref:Uncharacterized protein n=1 Tax=Devosia geojensis TaxID=443610 RepID=A0A0F5FW19_9HYPH|nr:hypothetical protein VE25_07520 [Devosia geojensis]